MRRYVLSAYSLHTGIASTSTYLSTRPFHPYFENTINLYLSLNMSITTNPYFENTISDNLSLGELRSLLEVLFLSTTGGKPNLQARILRFYIGWHTVSSTDEQEARQIFTMSRKELLATFHALGLKERLDWT